MDLFKSIKRVAQNIVAKNHRRRTRVKGTSRKNGIFEGKMNTAQTMLIAWVAPPSRHVGLGVSDANLRAAKRLTDHKAQWKDGPVAPRLTRQVRRAAYRLAEKAGRQVNVSGISLDWCIGASELKNG